jgi:hypothetical protein
MSEDFNRWLAANPEPSLAELIRRHGDYAAIPPDAWAEFVSAMTAWQRLRRARYGGEISMRKERATRNIRRRP